ncbi:ABC transporter permease [Mariniplasma anaerobium]|uniref:Permease n=1 Tax=Mariniplasma anaerobium TaxID=2735436 RepID=A0A7U9XUM3_9MOLU|nr:FtsX-like permease family protein [Mariniplasma anaerobium]BCR35654.1 permease [Mariniplasma anaerobium]
MKLAFSIAWRFLMSAKKQTIVIVLGIAVGVSVQVFIGSLISGLQKDLVDTAIGSTSQLTIQSDIDRDVEISDTVTISVPVITDELLVDEIRAYSDVFDSVTETLSVIGFVQKDGIEKQVLFRGLDLQNAEGIYKFESDEKITYGRMPEADDEIMLGLGFLTEYEENDISLFDENNPITIEIKRQGSSEVDVFKIVGFFDLGVQSLNNSWGVGTLGGAREIYGTNAYIISSIEMQLTDPFQAEQLALELDNGLDSTYKTSNWMVEQASLLSGLQGQSISSLMIQVFVIIAVVLGIASTLAITVIQKSKQIGILKAMGLRDKDASLVFLFEGTILGVFGAIAGVLLGVGLSVAFVNFAVDATTGDPVVPLFISPSFIALSAAIALFASILSALFPALRSSKMTVIEVIRNA